MLAAMKGTGSRMTVQAAVDALLRRGLDPAAALQAGGLTREALALVDVRVPYANVQALWEHAAISAGDPHFGLRVAVELPDGYGVLDYLLRTSATLREGYQRLCAYLRIGYDQVDARTIEESRQLGLVRASSGSSPQYQQFLLATFFLRGQKATGLDWTPLQVKLAHDAPLDLAPLAEVFGCPIEFNGVSLELVVPTAAADSALMSADSPLLTVMLEYAQRLLDQVAPSADLRGRTQAIVIEELSRRLPTLAGVARALRLPPRALQRGLKELGTSLANIIDESRRALALSHLADASTSLGEIAFLLHFSEVSAFNRAFRRWMRCTPGAYRASLWSRPR
jgi:AraC-like DNA-binding protein